MRIHLGEGEHVILAERPSGQSLVWPFIRLVVGVVVLGAALAAARALWTGTQVAREGSFPDIALSCAGGALALWVLNALGLRRIRHWLFTWYVLTSERLILRRGLGGRIEDSVPLPAVYRVDIRQAWTQRMTRTASLRFSVAQGTQFSLKDVPNAPVFRAEIVDAISKAQQRHWHHPMQPGPLPAGAERGYA